MMEGLNNNDASMSPLNSGHTATMQQPFSLESLTFISYNCEHADSLRLPYLKSLFHECDFLLIQEHGLFQSKLAWFNELGIDVGVHGVSAMDESQVLRGRPHGGAAIIWHKDIAHKVTPIPWESKRFCAVILEVDLVKFLIVCVYMPCDDWRGNGNVIEYNNILNDICIVSNSVGANYVCIGGDYNTDLNRNTPQTEALKSYIGDNNLYICTNSTTSSIQYTYRSKINNTRTLIDHFIVSENLGRKLLEVTATDSIHNSSDHLPIKCLIDCNIMYQEHTPPPHHSSRPAWDSASNEEILMYMNNLDKSLLSIPLPNNIINCTNLNCLNHKSDIDNFHDAIIKAMIDATDESIPFNIQANSLNKSKVVTGWNNFVEQEFKISLYWHKLWVSYGRPEEGYVAEMRRVARTNYHKTRKLVIRQKECIKSDKLAESLDVDNTKEFWNKVKKYRNKGHRLPNTIDDTQGSENISNLFKAGYKNLYNSVSYNDDEMTRLKNDIHVTINEKFNSSNVNINNNSTKIHPEDIRLAMKNLKLGKNDGSYLLKSENLINASEILHGHLSLLYTIMLSHGYSPSGMVIGTMVPIQKGKFTDVTKSKNFRAITISSLLGKIFDIIVLNKENKTLFTNDLQFGFKAGASTTMCTSMIRETVSYFVNKDTKVYGLFLDATKAFDRVNYCKLFRILLNRGVCPLICRLLLNMYINQKLRVKWADSYSEEFTVTNGVKQGGVISPILYCIYIDGLINELIESGVGCYMSRVYAGIFIYADDIALLAPSVYALRKMLDISLNYAAKFDVKFNDKSQLIIFKPKPDDTPNPSVYINEVELQAVECLTHLGHDVNDNIFKCDASKCIKDFNIQTNLFLADFKNANSFIRNYLFFKYCTAFYGSQFLPIYDNRVMNPLFVAWRMAVRRVWRVPWTTHNVLLPHIAGVMPPELSFAKRSIKFINKLLISDNLTVKTITGMAINSNKSFIGSSYKHLLAKYDMNIKKVENIWNEVYLSQMEEIRISEQIKELCNMRDSYRPYLLSKVQIRELISFICTM